MAAEVAKKTVLISELSIRFAPSSHGDMETHLEKVRLLTIDCADIPLKFLERAIRVWVREKAFLPKASELFNYAREERSKALAQRGTGKTPEDQADINNQGMIGHRREREIHWIVENGECKLDWVR